MNPAGSSDLEPISDLEKIEETKLGIKLLVEGARSKTRPSFTIAGLIIPEKPVAEGILIRDTSIIWEELARKVTSDWREAYQVPSERWEELLAGAFRK
ncbi:hypothetical protein QCM77_44475 [Bradyrhizobium sp. SSUT18]|uniref:hypothetical protein n=1 Tax=Bradyrhizobium sp. SSUT18 TaxID=3040602 RepID=UPI00244B8393|nr:hypothetical protein [Bradyrhizobium sp. SSUT18]MDH2406839.1 hypothetical protein [Bradyrhizobium sp. SSUT18]